jgi:ABC-type transport system substrate-binding protein
LLNHALFAGPAFAEETQKMNESTRRHIGAHGRIACFAMTAAVLLAACSGAPALPATPVGAEPATAVAAPKSTDAPAAVPTEAPVVPTAAPLIADTKPTVAPTAAPAGNEPKRGGVYRMLGEMDLATLDSAQAGNFEDWWSAGWLIYQPLYVINRQGRLEPAMAADFPTMSADGTVLTIPIRRGVKFHNGREMTPDDVKFTFDRDLQIGWCNNYLGGVLGVDDVIAKKTKDLSGVKVVGPDTIEITLKAPSSAFLLDLTSGCFGIVPKAEVEAAGADWGTKVVIGTGPFKLKEWKTGEVVKYERNPDFYKTGQPYLDGVEIYVNVQQAQGVLRWESKEAEFAYSVGSADLARIGGSERAADIRAQDGTFFTYLGINAAAKPFNDVRVRKAVAMALDKGTYATKAGFAEPANGYISKIMPQYDPNFKSYQYNVEEAKKLLAEAGVTLPIKTAFYSGATGKEVGELIQADLKAIGIEVELLVGDYGVVEERWKNGEMAFNAFGGAPGYPDAVGLVDRWKCANLAAGEKQKPEDPCDRRINDLIAEANKLALDDPNRTAAFQKMQDIYFNEMVVQVPLYFRKSLGIGQAWVKNETLHPVYLLPELHEVWIDESAK